jgi:hypothetical protein
MGVYFLPYSIKSSKQNKQGENQNYPNLASWWLALKPQLGQSQPLPALQESNVSSANTAKPQNNRL